MDDGVLRADSERWPKLPASAPLHVSADARARPLVHIAGAYAGLARDLRVAAALGLRDPDSSALCLEGILWRIVRAWYAAHEYPPVEPGNLLRDFEQRAPELSWRLRLALRAPDVAARLAHARQLLAACAEAFVPAGGHTVEHDASRRADDERLARTDAAFDRSRARGARSRAVHTMKEENDDVC